ncbi:MAG: class I SAM-dependent methyltransferase [Candidatus Methanomethylicaceae archaeon]
MAPSDRKEIMRVFDNIAEEFSHVRKKIWKSLEDAAPFEREIILDLGSGSGRNTKYLLKKGATCVVAADISVKMVKILSSSLERGEKEAVHPVRCDALYLPFLESAFDKVIFIAAIHHIPGKDAKERAIKEVWRVLRPGGLLLITAWSLLQLRFLRYLPAMIALWLKGKDFGDLYVPWGREKRFYHLFTPRELRSLIKNTGFSIEKTRGEKVSSRLLPENWVVLARRV